MDGTPSICVMAAAGRLLPDDDRRAGEPPRCHPSLLPTSLLSLSYNITPSQKEQ
jgi:hypothetical protein